MSYRILPIFLFITTFTYSQSKYSCSSEEIAFFGNDITSYYDGKVLKGKTEHSLKFDGLNLQFNSEINKVKFTQNPDQYIPEYGGWCAIALTNGVLARPDFNYYKLQNGKLLFFEVKAFFNGKTAWERDPEINKIIADKNFAELFD
ncbi:MAG: YHS domain-containing (seleno)protein [Cyclobacteriaceae bacterium]